MKTDSSPRSTDQANTGGTPEEAVLKVKLLKNEWIVENAIGATVASARDQESAVRMAREKAPTQKASGIAVFAPDGTLKRSISV